MKPTTLLSLALAGSIASAQFITSVTQAEPATTEIAVLEADLDLRAVKAAAESSTSSEGGDDESTTSTTSKKTTSTKTTSTSSKTTTGKTTTTTSSKTTSTTSHTTSTSSHTTESKSTVTSTSTTSQQSGNAGASSNPPTDTTTSSGSSGTTDSSSSANSSNNGDTSTAKGLSAGATAGIAVGAVAAALAIVGAVFFCWRKRTGGVRGAVVTAEYPPHMSDHFSRPPREPTLPNVGHMATPSAMSGGSMSQGPYSSVSSQTDASSTAYSNTWLGAGAAAGAGAAGAAAGGYAHHQYQNHQNHQNQQYQNQEYQGQQHYQNQRPQRTPSGGYRPMSYEDRMDGSSHQGHNSYQRLLPVEETAPPVQNHERYEPMRGQDYSPESEVSSPAQGQAHGGWETSQPPQPQQQQYRDGDSGESSSNLPAFMIPGGSARRASLSSSNVRRASMPLNQAPPVPLPQIAVQEATPIPQLRKPVPQSKGQDHVELPA